jgi:hypothetical protein
MKKYSMHAAQLVSTRRWVVAFDFVLGRRIAPGNRHWRLLGASRWPNL